MAIITNRRLATIGLRSFLALIACVGVWLGWIGNRARQQHAAVQQLRQLGGVIDYDYQSEQSSKGADQADVPSGPAWFSSLVGVDVLNAPVAAELQGTGFTDSVLTATLSHMPELRVLHVDSPVVTDASLRRIGQLSHLRVLDLHCPQITVEGLIQLKNPRLDYIVILRDRANEPLLSRLERPVQIAFSNSPLRMIIDNACQMAGVVVEYDTSLPPEAVDSVSVTVSKDSVPVGELLTELLEPHDLGWYMRHGTLVITTAEIARRDGSRAAMEVLTSLFPDATQIAADW